MLLLVVFAALSHTVLFGEWIFNEIFFFIITLIVIIFALILFINISPVDVVKTRIQLDPAKYNKGLIGGFKQVIAEEGAAGLATGLGPTVVGYFVQGNLIYSTFCSPN